MTYTEMIRKELETVKASGKSSGQVKRTIRHAEAYLAKGRCEYTNEDVDVMNSLCQCQNSWVK